MSGGLARPKRFEVDPIEAVGIISGAGHLHHQEAKEMAMRLLEGTREGKAEWERAEAVGYTLHAARYTRPGRSIEEQIGGYG